MIGPAPVKKTLFSLELIKSDQLEDVRQHSEIRLIMSDDYNHSYQIATKIMEKANGVIYPSARKKDGINFAIKNIELLGKETKYKESGSFDDAFIIKKINKSFLVFFILKLFQNKNIHKGVFFYFIKLVYAFCTSSNLAT